MSTSDQMLFATLLAGQSIGQIPPSNPLIPKNSMILMVVDEKGGVHPASSREFKATETPELVEKNLKHYLGRAPNKWEPRETQPIENGTLKTERGEHSLSQNTGAAATQIQSKDGAVIIVVAYETREGKTNFDVISSRKLKAGETAEKIADNVQKYLGKAPNPWKAYDIPESPAQGVDKSKPEMPTTPKSPGEEKQR